MFHMCFYINIMTTVIISRAEFKGLIFFLVIVLVGTIVITYIIKEV